MTTASSGAVFVGTDLAHCALLGGSSLSLGNRATRHIRPIWLIIEHHSLAPDSPCKGGALLAELTPRASYSVAFLSRPVAAWSILAAACAGRPRSPSSARSGPAAAQGDGGALPSPSARGSPTARRRPRGRRARAPSGTRGAPGLQPPRCGRRARRGCEEELLGVAQLGEACLDLRKPLGVRLGRWCGHGHRDADHGFRTGRVELVSARPRGELGLRRRDCPLALCDRLLATLCVDAGRGVIRGATARRQAVRLGERVVQFELPCPHRPRRVRSAGASGRRARHAGRAVPRARLRPSSALHVV